MKVGGFSELSLDQHLRPPPLPPWLTLAVGGGCSTRSLLIIRVGVSFLHEGDYHVRDLPPVLV